MNILITGANGQVAYEILRQADPNKFVTVAFTRNEVDITDAELMNEVIETILPAVVINTAAYTKVDQAEVETKLAYTINRDAVKNLSIACDKYQIPLFHLSTDYIFDGEKKTPYVESDAANPLNVYGKSKWEGEEEIRKNCDRHIILRVSAVFGLKGVNFVKTMMRMAEVKENLRVVSDQLICPTPAKSIAAVLLKLCEAIQHNPAWGTYHFGGDHPTNWCEFAKKIIDETKKHKQVLTKHIEAIHSEEYPVAAKRPNNSVLDCSLLENTFGILTANWEKELADVVAQLSLQGIVV